MTEELFHAKDEETGFTVSVTGEEEGKTFSICVTEPDAWTDAKIEDSLENAISVAYEMLAEAVANSKKAA